MRQRAGNRAIPAPDNQRVRLFSERRFHEQRKIILTDRMDRRSVRQVGEFFTQEISGSLGRAARERIDHTGHTAKPRKHICWGHVRRTRQMTNLFPAFSKLSPCGKTSL